MDNDIKLTPELSESNIIYISDDNMNSSYSYSSDNTLTIDLSTIDLSTAATTTMTDSIITISGSSLNEYDLYPPSRDEFNEMKTRVEQLEKIIAEELEIRAKYPAVKQAYDEYKLLSVLAKQHSEPVDN